MRGSHSMTNLEQKSTDGDEEPKRKLTWFDSMEGYLEWRVFGPDIYNPYRAPYPIVQLKKMAYEPGFLGQFIRIRCMCDGYEVMIISNPFQPVVKSEHPCVRAVVPAEIFTYMEEAGVSNYVRTEMERIQAEILKYVSERVANGEAEKSEVSNDVVKKIMDKKKGEKKSIIPQTDSYFHVRRK